MDGASAQPRQKVWGGERIDVHPDRSRRESADLPQALPLAVVFEDDAILVLDKPAGMVVHPGSGNRDGTLLNALLHHAPELANLPRAGIVHRLDKDTSGLLVVAKTPAAQTSLVRQLQARSVRRDYLAVVLGVPSSRRQSRGPGGPSSGAAHAHGRRGDRQTGADALPGAAAPARAGACSSAAWRPVARTRSACTLPPSVIPCWAIPTYLGRAGARAVPAPGTHVPAPGAARRAAGAHASAERLRA